MKRPRKIKRIEPINVGWTVANHCVVISSKVKDREPKAERIGHKMHYAPLSTFVLHMRGAGVITYGEDKDGWELYTSDGGDNKILLNLRATDELQALVLAQPILDEINRRWPDGYFAENKK